MARGLSDEFFVLELDLNSASCDILKLSKREKELPNVNPYPSALTEQSYAISIRLHKAVASEHLLNGSL